MPELPDITAYNEALARTCSPVTPCGKAAAREPVRAAHRPAAARRSRRESRSLGTRRIGKRVVLEFPGELFVVVHLMISGRFKLAEPDAKIPGKVGLAAFDWEGRADA